MIRSTAEPNSGVSVTYGEMGKYQSVQLDRLSRSGTQSMKIMAPIAMFPTGNNERWVYEVDTFFCVGETDDNTYYFNRGPIKERNFVGWLRCGRSF